MFDRKQYMKFWRERNASHVEEYSRKQREKLPTYPCACGCDKKIRTGEYSQGHSPKNFFKIKNPGKEIAQAKRNKGKGWVMSHGYKALRRDDKDVLEHRYIMEKHLGRKLNGQEHVHHKNGNGLDNRIENLEIMDAGEHHSHHVGGHISKEDRVLILNRLKKGFSLRKSIEGTTVKSIGTPAYWKRIKYKHEF